MAIATQIRALAGLLVTAAFIPGETLTLDELLGRMQRSDSARAEALAHYKATRRYVLTNDRFSKRAEILAKIDYRHPGEKRFDVVSETGPGVLRNRVLRKMIESESEGSRPDKLNLTRINTANYTLRLLPAEMVDGREMFVLDLQPRSGSPYLIRGKAWVDAEEYAVVKMEGTLAKNPSFWTRETRIIARYGKFGDFWLPLSHHSSTDARFFGNTEVVMNCYDYELSPRPTAAALR